MNGEIIYFDELKRNWVHAHKEHGKGWVFDHYKTEEEAYEASTENYDEHKRHDPHFSSGAPGSSEPD